MRNIPPYLVYGESLGDDGGEHLRELGRKRSARNGKGGLRVVPRNPGRDKPNGKRLSAV